MALKAGLHFSWACYKALYVDRGIDMRKLEMGPSSESKKAYLVVCLLSYYSTWHYIKGLGWGSAPLNSNTPSHKDIDQAARRKMQK